MPARRILTALFGLAVSFALSGAAEAATSQHHKSHSRATHASYKGTSHKKKHSATRTSARSTTSAPKKGDVAGS